MPSYVWLSSAAAAWLLLLPSLLHIFCFSKRMLLVRSQTSTCLLNIQDFFLGLKVMSLNTWGMPRTFGSEDKSLRMEAIGNHIKKGEYDVYLLEELWMRPDHNVIKSLIPEGSVFNV